MMVLIQLKIPMERATVLRTRIDDLKKLADAQHVDAFKAYRSGNGTKAELEEARKLRKDLSVPNVIRHLLDWDKLKLPTDKLMMAIHADAVPRGRPVLTLKLSRKASR